MSSTRITEVGTFIDTYIFHSDLWDAANPTLRGKAVNNCEGLLMTTLKDRWALETDIPIDILANQVVWFMRIDDTFLRAEMGASYIQMAGVMVNIKDKDRSISPYVLTALDITPDAITGGITKRKVGSYSGRTVGTPYSTLREDGSTYATPF